MVEAEFREHWDRLLVRDYLLARPDVARRYEKLKLDLVARHAGDRLAYSRGKAEFLDATTAEARKHFGRTLNGDPEEG
jgi:GrpB-like predicted nucleotidyltransferase (UPF0157 family)